MPLTVLEKARLAHHMGHPNLSEIATWRLGVPALTEQNSLFLRAVEGQNVLEERLPLLRDILCALDRIDRKRLDLVEGAEVESVGDVKLRRIDDAGLETAYSYWLGRLEDYLGCPRNPFSRAHGGGVNLRVA